MVVLGGGAVSYGPGTLVPPPLFLPRRGALRPEPQTLISQKRLIMSFCKSQFPHKCVNLAFIITNIKNKLTDLCENRLLQNDFINTFYAINLRAPPHIPRGRGYMYIHMRGPGVYSMEMLESRRGTFTYFTHVR